MPDWPCDEYADGGSAPGGDGDCRAMSCAEPLSRLARKRRVTLVGRSAQYSSPRPGTQPLRSRRADMFCCSRVTRPMRMMLAESIISHAKGASSRQSPPRRHTPGKRGKCAQVVRKFRAMRSNRWHEDRDRRPVVATDPAHHAFQPAEERWPSRRCTARSWRTRNDLNMDKSVVGNRLPLQPGAAPLEDK